MTHEEKQIHNAVHAELREFDEFLELVRKMREAQTEERKWGIVNFKTEEDKVACGEAIRLMYQLESEVDEYLKKMEDLK